jgi:Ca-activated chloride channel family protein
MNFGQAHLFVWLWLIPLAGLCLYWSYRRKGQRLSLILGQKATLRLSRPSIWLKSILILVALLTIVLALARPRLGFEWTEFKREGVDIMIALDVSNSMLAQDVKPSRLMRARREIVDLLQILQGDRVGLTAFAGDAFIQCPMTEDYNAVRLFLDSLTPDLIPTQGTDLARAIEVASAGLRAGSSSDTEGQALILITDGEDLEGKGLAAAKEAAKQGIKLFTIGVGSQSGAPIPLSDGGFKKDRSGNVVVTKPDERTLQEMAVASDGIFVRSVAGDMDLDRIYTNGIRKSIEAREFTASRRKVWYERYQWFLLVGLVLLIIEFFVRDIKKANTTLLGVLIGFLLMAPPGKAANLEGAHEAFKGGEFDKAAEGFLQAELESPKNLDHAYNRAVSQYKAKDYEGAVEGFKRAAKSTDEQLAKNSLFNLGNTHVQAGSYDEAIAAYEELLSRSPEDDQAKENLAYAKHLKENPPPPKPDKDKNNNDKQDQDKQNQDKQDQDKQDQDKQDQDKQDQDKQDQDKQDQDKQDQDKQDQEQDQDSGKDEQENNEEQPKPDQLDNGQDQDQDQKQDSEEKERQRMGQDSGAMDKEQAEQTLRAVQEAPPTRGKPAKPKSLPTKDW